MRLLITIAALALSLPTLSAEPVNMSAKMVRPANPANYYPGKSFSRREEGAPMVRACVGADGKLLRDPIVVESSGFPDLDGAAIKVAKATRYAAGTENGSALPESCIKFKVKFVLKNN